MPAARDPLTPPDLAKLPSLPSGFRWRLPAAKQPRRPMPEGRQIHVDDGKDGPAVASVRPDFGAAHAQVGLHRSPYSGGQHARTFSGPDARATAIRFVARWVELRAAEILAEYAQRPYR